MKSVIYMKIKFARGRTNNILLPINISNQISRWGYAMHVIPLADWLRFYPIQSVIFTAIDIAHFARADHWLVRYVQLCI
jgi:hypothetical protein